MKPLDFYRFGTQMAETATDEVECRTTIGRMYYGLHHEACCRYFRENPDAVPLGRGSRHSQLLTRFSTSGANSSSRIARLLRQLSIMRNISDYELGNSVRYNNLQVSACQLMKMASIVALELHQTLDEYSPGEAEEGCECRTV